MVLSQVLAAIGLRPDCRVWRNETGFIRSKERAVRYGLVGSADILGLTSDGKFLAMEIKVGRDRQSEQQRRFERMIKRMGGRYFVISSADEATAAIDGLGLKEPEQ